MPEQTLLAFSDHGEVERFLEPDSPEALAVVARLLDLGVDLDSLARRVQGGAAEALVASWPNS